MSTIINPVRVVGIPTVVFVADPDNPTLAVIGASQDVTPETLINHFGQSAPMVAYVYNYPETVIVADSNDESLGYVGALSEGYHTVPHPTDKIYVHIGLAYCYGEGIKLIQKVTLTRIERNERNEVTLYTDLLTANTLTDLMCQMDTGSLYGKFTVVNPCGDDYLIPHEGTDDLPYYNVIFDIPGTATKMYHTCPEIMIQYNGDFHYAEAKKPEFCDEFLSDLSEEIDDMFDDWLDNNCNTIQPIVKFSPIEELEAF